MPTLELPCPHPHTRDMRTSAGSDYCLHVMAKSRAINKTEIQVPTEML